MSRRLVSRLTTLIASGERHVADVNAADPSLHRAGRYRGRGDADGAGLIVDGQSVVPLPVGMPNFAALSSRSALLKARSRCSASASSLLQQEESGPGYWPPHFPS